MLKRMTTVCALIALCAVSTAQAVEYGEYGGYVSNEESRFKKYVWDFIDEIGKDDSGLFDVDHESSWINNKYRRVHYTYSTCSHLVSSANSYVDKVDLAYVAGHGGPSVMWMNNNPTSCKLTNADYGSDLESIVFHSCQVLSMNSGWRARWRKYSSSDVKPFNGLHHAMGFTTNHNNGIGAGKWTSDEYAENLEAGYSVRYAWYEAAEDGYWLSPYAVIVQGKNKQAIYYTPPHRNENMTQQYNYSIADAKYGSSNYALYAYYRK